MSWNVINGYSWFCGGNIWNFETTGNRGNSKYKENFGNNNKIGCKVNRVGKEYMENREFIEYRENEDKL